MSRPPFPRTFAVVVGARPNFMKAAPVVAAMARRPDELRPLLVHTGQHYDANLSDVFFRDLDLPEPAAHLDVGSGSHAEQTAKVMIGFERFLLEHPIDGVVVVGDVNSTLAAAITAAKLRIPVAHVEAGLRSFDRSMPEETNRLLTDQVSDWLFTTEASAERNLLREGIPSERIHFVGNVMIDSLVRCLPLAERSPILEQVSVAAGEYAVVTLHRPSNVDDPKSLAEIVQALAEIAEKLPVVFPVHPRTRCRLPTPPPPGLVLTEPLAYLDFLALLSHARLVLTDSGGLQEETTYLGVPCLTLRENTERPVTIEIGTNRLVPPTRSAIESAATEALGRAPGTAKRPPLWDGKAAERIVAILATQGRWSGDGR